MDQHSVSILPGSLYDQYDFGPLKKCNTTVVLADHSTKLPRGILTDVIVKVEDFYYPVDFLVLDYVSSNKNKPSNVILGRPFLATAGAQIDCIGWTHRHAHELEEQEQLIEAVAVSEKRPPWSLQVDPLPEHIDSKLKPSLESSPKVELKELPKNLKYAFLGEGETLPVIIAADLNQQQEKVLLKVLKNHKAAIGWTIADLKGISPSIVMHKIITDADAKPSRDAQRRLNPNMREVVKKEVLKWLDAGIIYPVSDSTWVSPTQTVPKKSGIQVVKSEDGEHVATRPVTGWRVCIDYRKLNAATSKDHFPLPFIDQIIEKLSDSYSS
ncbi:hypothetical protein QVD17_37113 [Tagetes erecta]|uniref:Uncharacterized protein n=1 Tax=Tagetes erecta TaxID=13708 RepID=A0AAD8JXL1_TARER|nr:hypothetical protein QVD17_37113 [Tagetes erecta]